MGTTRVKIVDLSSENEEKKIKQPKKVVEQKPATPLIDEVKVAKGEPRSSDEREEKTPSSANIEEEKSQTLEEEAAQITKESSESKKVENPKEESQEVVKKPAKKAKPKKQKHHLGKKYQSAKAEIEDKLYTPSEALELITKTSFTKFDPTVEIHLNVTDKNIKGSVNFPHSVGAKKSKTALFLTDKKVESTKNIKIGDEKTIDEIEKGNLKPGRDFDIVYSTPKYMPLLAKVAKILGPRGLMPNPKNGTIIEDIKKIQADESANSYDYKCDPKAPIIHAKLGKLSAKSPNLNENLKALILSVGPSKITKATLASTMSPGIRLDISKN